MHIKIGNQVFEPGEEFVGREFELGELKMQELGAAYYEVIDPDDYRDAATRRERVLSEIRDAERLITTRRLTEAVLSEQGRLWLQAQSALIADKRAQLNSM